MTWVFDYLWPRGFSVFELIILRCLALINQRKLLVCFSKNAANWRLHNPFGAFTDLHKEIYVIHQSGPQLHAPFCNRKSAKNSRTLCFGSSKQGIVNIRPSIQENLKIYIWKKEEKETSKMKLKTISSFKFLCYVTKINYSYMYQSFYDCNCLL